MKQAAAATQFPMARSLVLHNIFRDVADRHIAATVIECRNLRSFVRRGSPFVKNACCFAVFFEMCMTSMCRALSL